MSISRISKAIAEVRRDQKFQDAEDVRRKDIDLFLGVDSYGVVQGMVQTATALLLRCFKGRIRIHLQGADIEIKAILESEAKKMAAANRLDFAPDQIGPWRLALGCKFDGAISADASGWTARINGVFENRTSSVAPAMTFAVSCAVAKLFNKAIFGVDKHADESWDFCLSRFQVGNLAPMNAGSEVNLGRIGLLGAGAIGSAVGFVLRLSDWAVRLEIIDFDSFEDPNLETCVSADDADVRRPLHKAVSLARTFQGHRIAAVHRDCRVLKDAPILKEEWNCFICGVDNGPTRLILDDVNARCLLNAGLGGTKQDAGWVLWTRHAYGSPTLSSIYENSADVTESGYVPDEFREECSRRDYNGVSLALPFVALAAGSLLAASIYQNACGLKIKINSLQIDLFGKQQRFTSR